jgi:hypothetical protein
MDEGGGYADFSGIKPSGQLLDQLDAQNVDAADLMETLDPVVGLHKIIAQG